MPPLRRSLVLVALASLAAGCGYQIGQSCIVDTDCSADGTRVCDNSEPNGYCTILGCDYNTCPDNSECVRFFTGSFANDPCMYGVADGECSYDEECSIQNECVPRAAEIRYCMATCDNDGDCNDGYECRKFNIAPGSDTTYIPGTMQEDGGEVVLTPGDVDNTDTKGFCAPAESTGG